VARPRKQARGLTTLKGVGHRHRQQREYLLGNLVDGAPCWWCARGLFREPSLNFDHKPLAADHSIPRSTGVLSLADRLLHGDCNSARGSGERDHLRPALTGVLLDEPAKPDLGVRAMPWPR
jgi:hypothetical protein